MTKSLSFCTYHVVKDIYEVLLIRINIKLYLLNALFVFICRYSILYLLNVPQFLSKSYYNLLCISDVNHLCQATAFAYIFKEQKDRIKNKLILFDLSNNNKKSIVCYFILYFFLAIVIHRLTLIC